MTRALFGDPKKKSRPGLRREQFDGFAKRGYGGCVLVVFEKQHSQIHVSRRHLGIKRRGTLVLGLRFFRSFQCRVDVSELKMAVGKVLAEEPDFLKRREGSLKLFPVDVTLCFFKQVVERIGKLLRFGLTS